MKNYMQNKQNFHYGELKKEAVLVRISDVDLFPPQSTLSWKINEPTDSIVKELFDIRFDLMSGAKKDCLKLHSFRVLSRSKAKGGSKFCAFWIAKIQSLQNGVLPDLNLAIKENQILFFHGRFIFWRVENVWKAKTC